MQYAIPYPLMPNNYNNDSSLIRFIFSCTIGEVGFPKLNSFVESLSFDDNGNLSAVVVVNGEVHEISLNFTHRPIRGGRDRMTMLKEEAKSIKQKIVENLIQNVNDQNQSGTIFEYASSLDFHRKLDLEERCQLLAKLADVYCNDYTHNVVHDNNDDDFWKAFCISIKHPAKIQESVEEVLKEFKNLYPICNRKWDTFSEDKKEGNYAFWSHMLSYYSISHPSLCKLVRIIFSIASNTGPLERSYSRLAKLCYKDRNKLTTEHMETQYILSSLKEYDFDYKSARELMEASAGSITV